MVAVGVDACRQGWVAVAYQPGTDVRGVLLEDLADLSATLPEATGVGVDIPIGLLDDRHRAADLAAREVLGPRRSSIFVTPVRSALHAPTHAEASARNREVTGHGISQQAYALRGKIRQAETWVARASLPVWEVHPEVSFTTLTGRPASASKRTWAGLCERLEALRAVGIEIGRLDPAGERAGADDVIDATLAAWSTHRLLAGRGRSLPDPPEHDPATGRPIAIWA
jgi:predicted RNase H-like nuclease